MTRRLRSAKCWKMPSWQCFMPASLAPLADPAKSLARQAGYLAERQSSGASQFQGPYQAAPAATFRGGLGRG
ncbi:hypothetical protein WJX72_003832 [[Myrmecia] bisecta]|uniref:Uncharacterized protein n=1 Tax=[Myrmecia] bisecta TaxID=41462 RepID=A0AAW1Q2X2_9CHLO